ncbi:exopolysaccharide biosynthesis protein [Methyloprofundus sedimenti]|uniref:Exopolysaccharide biosynthesis protein n=1 Tax=Methyloprofundus sedimenti TaxID=1420851 RepID=A0A1V8M2R1_9GAMM|nr:DUF4422 domain-containing protein [Methyloprofundus sedimenti]OQK15844.1 exopolysaccharide biosynthesis protein [Methyloprofundus sedimenti]
MNNILISTHKNYTFPKSAIYTPIQVGKLNSSEYFDATGDDTGTNISSKNNTFCELTALYWAWKNGFFKGCEFCGLVHYRRYFKGSGETLNGKQILSEGDILKYLEEYDVLMPKKRHYYIETVASHYAHAHYQKDMLMTRRIIALQESDYLNTFDALMSKRSLYLFNMFVMSPKHFNAYMDWLFPLLFTVEDNIDIQGYDNHQIRVFGYISERLFNVWILKNNLRVKELAIQNLEGENLLLKAWGLIKRKIAGKKL